MRYKYIKHKTYDIYGYNFLDKISRIEKCKDKLCQACTIDSTLLIKDLWFICPITGKTTKMARPAYHVNGRTFEFEELDEKDMAVFEVMHS